MKRMANSVKEELEQELKIEQLHADLKKAESKGLSNLSPELQESIEQLKQAAQSVNRPYQVQDTTSTQDNQIHNPASQTVSTEASPTSASSAPKSESIQGEDPRSNTKANG